MKTPHKHADLIHAWADGAEIESRAYGTFVKKGEMLGTMLVIATTAHAGQFDRGGAPYILPC